MYVTSGNATPGTLTVGGLVCEDNTAGQQGGCIFSLGAEVTFTSGSMAGNRIVGTLSTNGLPIGGGAVAIQGAALTLQASVSNNTCTGQCYGAAILGWFQATISMQGNYSGNTG